MYIHINVFIRFDKFEVNIDNMKKQIIKTKFSSLSNSTFLSFTFYVDFYSLLYFDKDLHTLIFKIHS